MRGDARLRACESRNTRSTNNMGPRQAQPKHQVLLNRIMSLVVSTRVDSLALKHVTPHIRTDRVGAARARSIAVDLWEAVDTEKPTHGHSKMRILKMLPSILTRRMQPRRCPLLPSVDKPSRTRHITTLEKRRANCHCLNTGHPGRKGCLHPGSRNSIDRVNAQRLESDRREARVDLWVGSVGGVCSNDLRRAGVVEDRLQTGESI